MIILPVIQCRIGSSRLRNKILLNFKGESIIERIYKEVSKIDGTLETFVICDSESRDVLSKILPETCLYSSKKIKSQDVYKRFNKFFEEININKLGCYCLRVTGDCPLITSEMITNFLKTCKSNQGYNYYSNTTIKQCVNDGFDLELFNISSFSKFKWLTDEEREHPTKRFYSDSKYKCFSDFSQIIYKDKAGDPLKLSVDEMEDYIRVLDYPNNVV